MDHNLINVTSGLISVVICTYNRSRLLINAIESVLSQSYPFKELIVLDGNSTDDTPNLMKQYETNPSVIYIRDVVDKGPQFYLKEGLRLSHGEYVVFMDDDDYYTDCDFFSKAINVYSNSKLNVLSFVSANVQKYDVIKSEYIDYVPLSISGYMDGIDYLGQFMTEYPKPVSVFSSVFKKSCLLNSGVLNLDWFIDSIIYMRALLSGSAYILEDVVGVYRVHDDNLSKRLSPDFIQSGLVEKRKIYEIISRDNLFVSPDIWWINIVKISMGYYVWSTSPRMHDFNSVARWCFNTSSGIRFRILLYLSMLKLSLYYQRIRRFISETGL